MKTEHYIVMFPTLLVPEEEEKGKKIVQDKPDFSNLQEDRRRTDVLIAWQ